MFDLLNEATQSWGGGFGGRDYSAPSAQQPQETQADDAGPYGFLGGLGQTVGDLGRGLAQEGLSGLVDPLGMLDRQEAQRDLMDRFNVVNPEDMVCGPNGDLPVNSVSPEEFRQIAHNYSDIRMGRTDIDFNVDGLSDDDAAAFRSGSMNDIASIMQTDHGRDLIGDLAHNENDHTTTLSPLFLKNDDGDRDASQGLDNTNGFASREGDANDAWQNADGTAGDGTDSRVRYNPGQMISPEGATDAWLPWRSDVLLYHELTHSRDHTLGTLERGRDPDTNEKLREQRATGIHDYEHEHISENAYRADRRRIAEGGVGARDGDATMPHRDTYFYHTD